MRNLLLSVLLLSASTSVFAEKTPEPDTRYTVPAGYLYFRLVCERYNFVDTTSYVLSFDKKIISGTDNDGDTFTFINTGCLIRIKK